MLFTHWPHDCVWRKIQRGYITLPKLKHRLIHWEENPSGFCLIFFLGGVGGWESGEESVKWF